MSQQKIGRFGMSLRFGVMTVIVAATAFMSLGAGILSAAKPEPIDHAFISFRIAGSIWEDPAEYESLLNLFDKYPRVTDEITFFTDNSHTPAPVDVFDGRIAVIKERIAAAKARGYKSGINILCTIGHHPESLPTGIGPEYPRAMTLDGRVAQGTLCMNQEIFRERVRHIYTVMAEADPDYIWIDDDVRVGHWTDSSGNGGNLCFCDACMAILSERFGEPMTRETLAPRMGEQAARAIVHRFNADTINELFARIEQTVHAVRPGLPLGFMTGERYPEGYDFARWSETLAGPDNAPVWWRPGGGFYMQEPIGGMVGKSHEVGRQVSLLPTSVRVIESEIENFPYAPHQKSRHVTALEAACHMAAGCTGAAFNVLTMNHEPLDDYEPLVAELARWRPFYDLLAKHLGRRPLIGVHPMWKPTDADNPAGNAINSLMLPLAEIGLPIAYAQGDSPVLIPGSGFLSALSADEAKSILSHGVYTDVPAVSILNDPAGHAMIRWTGIEWGSDHPVDSIERYTADPLNAGFVGVDRDQRQSFWRDNAVGLHLTDPTARSLGELIDYTQTVTAKTSMAVFENELGGRVGVAGYHPWNYFHSRPKSTQMKRVMRWLSKDQLCAWVDSFERGNLWVRADETGGASAMVFLNATYDAAEKPALMIRTTKNSVTFYDRSCRPVKITASGTDGPYRRFELPQVAPWEAVLVTVE